MIGDPNWLYSTIAQSSAAIVAIVGGFITASILMLLAEKRTLERQFDVKRLQLVGLEEEVKEEMGTRKRDLEREISLLATEAAELRLRLETFSYPPNLGWGIAVLGYLALFGILFPVSLIFNELYHNFTRVAAIVTFSIGIIGIFIYVVLLINTLRSNQNKQGGTPNARNQS